LTIRLRHLIWMLPVTLAVIVVLLGVLADSWLESSGGRHMLQTELSKSLGLPVRLNGDYSLKLFPRLEIAGRDLEVGQTGGAGSLALGEEYSAVVELAPFIHREVKITSVRVHGGFVELGNLPKATGDRDRESLSQIAYPQVASLEIDNFRIRRQPEEKSILIDRLLIKDFRQGREAKLDLRALLMDSKSEIARMSMHGGLTLAAGDLPSRLDVREMAVDWGAVSIEGLSGDWEWDPRAVQLAARVDWQHSGGSADLRIDIRLESTPSGSFLIHYQGSPLPEPATLGFDYSIDPGNIELSDLDITMGGQSLAGWGCMILSDPPTLNLSLQAESLDLDTLHSIDWKPQGDGAEIPLKLAVELRVQKAWFAGAEGTGVVVATGPKPECSGASSKD